MFCKKELAGRTMEFTFDVSQTPLIGRRILLKTEEPGSGGAASAAGSSSLNSTLTNATTVTVAPAQQVSAQLQQHRAHSNVAAIAASAVAAQQQQQQGVGLGSVVGTPNSPRRSASLSPADTVPLSGWKRPWMSQCRVRECLVNLLTTCGQRVGLPKSPSVSLRPQRLRPGVDIFASLYIIKVHALSSPSASFFSSCFLIWPSSLQNYLFLLLFLSCKKIQLY